ncbi:hypothetical protein BDV59DRAFT_192302 [Aspergillus ambiguus]|uniref:putative polyketide synthase n=1 Tax=Aspergillus ambiguus TaxID=176160 RepID=UPI003CCE44FF
MSMCDQLFHPIQSIDQQSQSDHLIDNLMTELRHDNTVIFHFLEGDIDSDPGPGIAGFYDGPYYSYYKFPQPFSNPDPDDASLLHAYDRLYGVLDTEGPFDGILGFSHGGTLAAGFLIYHAKLYPQEPPLLRCAIFINSLPPFRMDPDQDPVIDPDLEGYITIPTLSIGDDLPVLSPELSMSIAIIGMGFRGPGDATNVEKLWNMILEGREAWSPVPESKWNHSAFYHPDYARHGTTNVEGGHFLREDVSLFDAPFFNMTTDEAAAMDPQQRLLLEVTYEALENAGMPLHKIMGSHTACFVGCFNADYTDLLLRDPERIPIYQCTNSGQSRAMTANRISYFFDMKGPSVTVDTACSGSLVALHLACTSLQCGDASMAIAAGVNVILSHEFMSTLSMMKFLSPDGRCHTFDEKANGYGRGEGIGCIILKPLRNALRDNDPIRAVIRGSGLNQDGRTPGITLPNGASQEALIRSVYQRAALSPSDTEFAETHGTGTQAGDPIEARALGRVFSENRDPRNPLRIGSVKTNVGHLEGASGVAAVIKAALMLENRVFVPNRNFHTLNRRILLDNWKLKVQACREAWKSPGPRRISVNSFGYGGSNAHVIMEEASYHLNKYRLNTMRPCLSETGELSSSRSRVYILSGFDELAITRQINSLQQYLLENALFINDEYLNNLAFTLNERRTHHRYRMAVIGNSAQHLIAALKSQSKIKIGSQRPNIGFIFTGQGAQWCGMGKELLEAYPQFLQSINRIDEYLKTIGAPFCTVDELRKGSDPSVLTHPLLSQPICSAVQIALVDLLASWGIRPDSVIGHSSGEIAAAYATGSLSTKDAMTVAYYRGVALSKLVLDGVRSLGGMLAVSMSADQAEYHIKQLKAGKAVIACINSPSSVTISGDIAAIEELQDVLPDHIFNRRLAVKAAYHSHHMELVANEYMASIAHVKPQSNDILSNYNSQRHISFFSSVTGAEFKPHELGPQYWVRNLVSQVNFVGAMKALCFTTNTPCNVTTTSDGKRKRWIGTVRKVRINHLIEVGAHAALSGPVKQIIQSDIRLKAAEIGYSSVLVRKCNAVTTALDVTATLACAGYPVNFQAINNPSPSKPVKVLVDLPQYEWNHSRSYWAEPRISKQFRMRKFPRTDLLGAPDSVSCPFEPRWRNILRVTETPWLQDHKIQSSIVYPAAGYIAMGIEAIKQLTREIDLTEPSICAFLLQDISVKSALIIPENSAVETMTSLRSYKNSLRTESMYEFHIYSVTDDNKWTEHCSGLVCIQTSKAKVSCPRISHSKFSRLNAKLFYERLSSIGLEYGPCFTNLSDAQFADNMSMAKVTIPHTASVMPANFEYPNIVHPCTLDSIIQTIFISIGPITSPVIPVHIDEISILSSITSTAGRELDVETEIHKNCNGEVSASIYTREKDGSIGISIRRLLCTSLKTQTTVDNQPRIHTAYGITWKLDPDFHVSNGLSNIFRSHDAPREHIESSRLLEACALNYIREFVEQLGQKRGYTGPLREEQLAFYQQVMRQNRGRIKKNNDTGLQEIKSSGPKGNLLYTMGQMLLDHLRDENSSLECIEDTAEWDHFWQLVHEKTIMDNVSDYLDLVCNKNPACSILELEAGRGGAFERFLEAYSESNPPCSRWSQRYSKSGGVIRFKQLDIEKDLVSQGIGKRKYDVVIGLHGLYTVNSKHVALKNIRTMLKKGGKLLLLDPVSNNTLTNAVIFSQYPGHWRNNHFGYSEQDWRTVLSETCFSPDKIQLSISESPSMFVAQMTPEMALYPADILIIADGHSAVCLTHLKELFLSASVTVEVVDIKHAKPTGKLCIMLGDLTQMVLAQPDPTTWEVTKEMFLRSSGVLWVTRGGAPSPISPEAGLVTGFARTARSESGVNPIVTLDLDGRKPLCEETAARIIYELIQYRFLHKSENIDTEYAERNGLLLIPRVVEKPDTFVHQDVQVSHLQLFHQPDEVMGSLPMGFFTDNSQKISPSDENIQIQVHTSNICRRSMCMVDRWPKTDQHSVGSYSGTVMAMGKRVCGLEIGDKVLCLASGPLARMYQDKATAFHKLPPTVEIGSAASLPVAYCTAMYVVRNVARISPGQKVLIHCGATSAGQAIMELCRRAKAEVFAVVSNTTERALLMSTSLISPPERILIGNESIDRDIMTVTEGEVDVLILCNDATDRYLLPSQKILRPYGHLIHLRTHPLQGVDTWKIAGLREDVIFAALDFDHLRQTRPDVVTGLFTNFGQLLRDGTINAPILPSFSVSDTTQAFEKLESDPSVDSVAITGISDLKATGTSTPEPLFKPDASYMLVGGLSGIGREMAMWMAEHGAKTLILVSRSGLSKAGCDETLTELGKKGTKGIVYACDVSNSDHMSYMTSELTKNAPPIKGVVQAAMVLKDVHIQEMSLEDYQSVLRPKYNGTWNLHRYLPSSLDWFIMLSSISGIIGNATQAAYAAASTFMDQFAAYRHSLGLPAISLDLGVITDSGYLSENTKLASKMAGQGFQGTDTATLMSLVEAVIANQNDNRMGPQIITGLGEWKDGQSLSNFDAPLFSHFRRAFSDPSTMPQMGASLTPIRAELQAAKTLDEAASVVYRALSKKVATNMSISVDNIGPSNPISEYGIDSHFAVDLRNWIVKSMDSTISILEILASGCLMDLAVKIAGKSALLPVD